MRELPMLFSDAMVLAIRADKKHQTRRLRFNGQPGDVIWIKEAWQTHERESDNVDGIRFRAGDAFVPLGDFGPDDAHDGDTTWLTTDRVHASEMLLSSVEVCSAVAASRDDVRELFKIIAVLADENKRWVERIKLLERRQNQAARVLDGQEDEHV